MIYIAILQDKYIPLDSGINPEWHNLLLSWKTLSAISSPKSKPSILISEKSMSDLRRSMDFIFRSGKWYFSRSFGNEISPINSRVGSMLSRPISVISSRSHSSMECLSLHCFSIWSSRSISGSAFHSIISLEWNDQNFSSMNVDFSTISTSSRR